MQKYLLVLLLAYFAVTVMPVFAGPAPRKGAAPAVKRSAAPASNTAALNAYLGRLRAKLINGWLVPDGKNNVVVCATLNNDGTVEAFETKGGDGAGQQSANDAFAKAQPFEVLPAGVNKAKLKLSFISTADPHGDSSSNVVTEMAPVVEPKPQPQTAAPPAEQK